MARKGREPVVSRADEAVTRIREMIVSGEFPADTHLQEIPLAERLGISRTPVRAALRTLAQEGLLVPGPRRGYKTRSYSLKDILDAHRVRAVLEGAACGLLAQVGLPEDARRVLSECLADGDRALSQGRFNQKDQASWVDMNDRFHRTIYLSTKNDLLISFIDTTHRLPLTSARNVHWYRFDDRNYFLAKQAHSHHHTIVDAILERDSARAEAAMREHIRFSANLLAEYHAQMTANLGNGCDMEPDFIPGPAILVSG